MKKLKIFVIFLSLSLINSTSGVILTGMMATYLARGLLSSLVDNTIKSVYTSTIPGSSSMTSTSTISRSPDSLDTLNTISQVIQALGIGRAIKDLFAEEEENHNCKGRKCKKKSNKRKRKRSDDDSSEEDGDSLIKPLFRDTEDYSKYIIRGDKDDPEEIANDLLNEDDPMNFYYVIKDTQKRLKKEKQGRSPRPQKDDHATHTKNKGVRDRPSPQPLRPVPAPPPNLPMYRPGRFPIFIRYRKRMPSYQ